MLKQQPNLAITKIAQKIQPLPNYVFIVGGTKEGRKHVASLLAEEYKRLSNEGISVNLDGEGVKNAAIKTFKVGPDNIPSKIIVFMTHDEAGQETFSAFFPPQVSTEPVNPIYIRNSLFPRGLVGLFMMFITFTTFVWFSLGAIKVADRYVLLQEAQAGYPAAKARLEKIQQTPDNVMEEVRK
jgi:hypothetical protein